MSDDPIGVDDLQVTGGSGGTSANLEDLRGLASTSGDLAGQMAGISASAHAILVDADWLASALLSPGTAAAASGVLLDALDGPSGLTWLAAQMEVRSTVVTTVANAYEAADEAQAAAMNVWEWFEGASGIALAEAGSDLYSAWQSGNMKLWLTAHPEAIDDLINSAPGIFASWPLSWPFVAYGGGPGAFFSKQSAISAVASYFPDSDYSVTALDASDPRLRTDRTFDFAPPTGISGLITDLEHRNEQAKKNDDIIDVQTIRQPDDTIAFIVNIPGTKDGAYPFQAGPNPNDMNTNLHVLAGETTAREQAIADAVHDAMAAAGADSDSAVMLVGHSQGGMVAAQAAADSEALGLNITHVVTAGSPIALADIPSDVQVLSLENSYDIVPHLDGADNTDAANLTTVTFDDQNATGDPNEDPIGLSHALAGGYAEAAAAIDQSDDPSLTAFLADANVFFDTGGGTTMDVQAYEIDRVP